MAKQKGIIKLEGTIGDITFYKSSDGYMAKQKSTVPAERIVTDPVFARTRENNAEFASANRSGKILRTAFRTQLQNTRDRYMTSRLVKALMAVIHSGSSAERGARTVSGGDIALLEGFDFNNDGKLSTTLFAPYTVTMDRTSGDVSVSVPAFAPAQMIEAPEGTTHF